MKQTAKTVRSRRTSVHRPRLALVLGVAIVVAALAPAAQTTPAAHQAAEMVDFFDGEFAPGAATLMRTKNGLTATLMMSGLDAGSAYTVWWVIWSHPAKCTDGCGEDDLFIRGNAVYYAGGFIATESGTANVRLSTQGGRTPAGMQNFTGARGLKPGRGLKSEVHLVVRRHARPRLGEVHIQTGTFEPHEAIGGACPDSECFDQYAFVFAPVEE